MNLARFFLVLDFLKNMGFRYVSFRLWFEFRRRSGLLKRAFPTNPELNQYVDLNTWKKLDLPFLFSSKEDLNFPKNKNQTLREEVIRIQEGEFLFFNASWYAIGQQYDWLTNPVSNYHYSNQKHWTDIPDFDPSKGDIKYVWEKSRFSYLLKIIRDDFHNNQDHSEWVFSEIDHWINKNPINQGPNWRCSQEISLRTLNWIFALYYYKDHTALTEQRFQEIIHTIYWQLQHIYKNIHFSRIAVRNNHAITESLMLFLGGLLFPFFPEAKKWETKGKVWLEKEIAYQIYEDGTYIQHSMNYHRVVIQLLSWGIHLAELHEKPLSKTTYQRAQKSIHFLSNCLERSTGHLPNYGNNDGALFFPLSQCHYRDYRPQLNALQRVLTSEVIYPEAPLLDEANWISPFNHLQTVNLTSSKIQIFNKGGYYLFKKDNSLTFIRCAKYKDRPSQADNLHLDIWYKGDNVLRDAGTYLYNGDNELLRHFWGSKGHNTVSLGQYDQMQKGSRFIWYYWTQAKKVITKEYDDHFFFKGEIKAFQHLDKGITHIRQVKKYKDRPEWEIIDTLNHNLNLPMFQYWHPFPSFMNKFSIEAQDEEGQKIEFQSSTGWYAPLYGQKEKSTTLFFETKGKIIITRIYIK